MNASDFACLADLLKRRAGFHLAPTKTHLATSRLAPVARRYGFRKTDELLAELRDAPEEMLRAVVEAMMVSESSFFRDKTSFDHFRGVILPSLLSARAASRRLRIWCAAAANGQEAYSLAMILDEAKIAKDWRIELIATDISTAAIARATEGRYLQYEVQRGLPAQTLVRYFAQDGDQWRISERIRRMVTFRSFNLLDSYGWLGEVDVIYCRNVLLYFEPLAKRACLQGFAQVLAPDGYLALGAAETMEGASTAFAPADISVRGIYRKARHTARPIALAS
ncbi:MAG TPA: protein-glutamate O-methyltransferase CheR [Rhizomicrobium sp.]|nr:protein-glutamate O-methyltransferase CheR [Rhizomicrobium sp.]